MPNALEVEQFLAKPVLEYEHQYAVARQDRNDVKQNRFEWQDQGVEEKQQDHVGHQQDQAHQDRKLAEELVPIVEHDRGLPAGMNFGAARNADRRDDVRAQLLHQIDRVLVDLALP